MDEKIARMRNGEKVKCPKCEKGYISAVGDMKITKYFQCDCCETRIILTVDFPRIAS